MKLLIAEDDPVTLDALATCMESDGFDVLQAKNGIQALDLWKKSSPYLICLDIMMPICDGYNVCKQIRRVDKVVPILFISAKNEEQDLITGLDLGADDFIRKPFTRGEVMARVRAALRRVRYETKEEEIAMLNICLKPQRLMATDGEKVIDLTPREISILRLLFENEGKPVSRDKFLDRCWGLDYFPDSRTLDQHILTLRKKIETNPSVPMIIQTVRGVGYKFMA